MRDSLPSSRVSVIVCAHTDKRWNYLVDTIDSLRKQTHAPHQIILVIDHNPVLLAKCVLAFPGVRVSENLNEQGLPGGRNTGLSLADGDIMAFIDDDAEAAPDWIEQLLLGYGNANIVGVGGGITAAWDQQKPGWFPEEFNWVVGCSYIGMPLIDAYVRNSIGCNMSFKAEVFEKVGGFRVGRVGNALGQENDDTEFCIRVSANIPNARILYRPAARVFHHVPGSRANLAYLLRRCLSEGISKARLARTVGSAGLSNERSYVIHTLPAGVLRGLGDTFLKFDPMGLLRSSAIVLAFTSTLLGYARGKLKPG